MAEDIWIWLGLLYPLLDSLNEIHTIWLQVFLHIETFILIETKILIETWIHIEILTTVRLVTHRFIFKRIIIKGWIIFFQFIPARCTNNSRWIIWSFQVNSSLYSAVFHIKQILNSRKFSAHGKTSSTNESKNQGHESSDKASSEACRKRLDHPLNLILWGIDKMLNNRLRFIKKNHQQTLRIRVVSVKSFLSMNGFKKKR